MERDRRDKHVLMVTGLAGVVGGLNILITDALFGFRTPGMKEFGDSFIFMGAVGISFASRIKSNPKK